tara:strand:+ start:1028 stop:1201 length:174 start_codon:yes stop_codon:yes gene_type:complete
MTHDEIVALYPNDMLDKIIADLGARNLREQRDHGIRFLAERSKALRAERRHRKGKSK